MFFETTGNDSIKIYYKAVVEINNVEQNNGKDEDESSGDEMDVWSSDDNIRN